MKFCQKILPCCCLCRSGYLFCRLQDITTDCQKGIDAILTAVITKVAFLLLFSHVLIPCHLQWNFHITFSTKCLHYHKVYLSVTIWKLFSLFSFLCPVFVFFFIYIILYSRNWDLYLVTEWMTEYTNVHISTWPDRTTLYSWMFIIVLWLHIGFCIKI